MDQRGELSLRGKRGSRGQQGGNNKGESGREQVHGSEIEDCTGGMDPTTPLKQEPWPLAAIPKRVKPVKTTHPRCTGVEVYSAQGREAFLDALPEQPPRRAVGGTFGILGEQAEDHHHARPGFHSNREEAIFIRGQLDAAD